MATSGKNSFEKYFKGKDIKTFIKNSTPLFDLNKNKIGELKEGENITLLSSSEYNTKPIILYKNQEYRVLFSRIAKPMGKNLIKIKPQDFNLSNVYSYGDLTSYLVEEQIPQRTDLPDDLKKYMINLTLHYGTNYKVKIMVPEYGLNEVQKDYSEILGALACVNHQILPFEILKNTLIEFPENGSEPLIDYLLHSKETHKISAKSGTNSNVVKAADLLKFSDGELKEFIQSIVKNSVLSFPFNAAEKYFNESHPPPKNNSCLIKTIPNLDYTYGELFYSLEKRIIAYANKNFSMDDIIKKLLSEITYVKYSVSNKIPVGEFLVLKQDEYSGSKWRTKNYTKRAGDKIGIQI